METKYNLKSPGVKRLLREAMELAHPTEEYYASPLEENLFEWHFTVRGPPSTEFEGGYYHGRILLPTQYPMQPPNIILLTPNGRFEVNKKICLSISGHHPESWQPSWSIRTALLALIAFMPTAPAGTIGSLDYTPEERRALAKKSALYECPVCGGEVAGRLRSAADTPSHVLTQEESSLIRQIALKAEDDGGKKVGEADGDREGSQDVVEQGGCVPNVTPSADSLLQMSIANTNRDAFWSTVIWVIASVIALLVMRRLFFL